MKNKINIEELRCFLRDADDEEFQGEENSSNAHINDKCSKPVRNRSKTLHSESLSDLESFFSLNSWQSSETWSEDGPEDDIPESDDIQLIPRIFFKVRCSAKSKVAA